MHTFDARWRALAQSALASVANYGQMIGSLRVGGEVSFFPRGLENVRLSKFAIVERIVCERWCIVVRAACTIIAITIRAFSIFFSLFRRRKRHPHFGDCVCVVRLFCLATWPICGGGGANVVCMNSACAK